MLFRYKDKPQEGDYVLCTVDAIVNHSVFVRLDEYGFIKGMIHISEIAPGRIRNIREFVTEGKKLICLILRVKRDRDQYDLSLRRVQLNKKRKKLEEIKQEQKAEKILEITTKQLGLDLKRTYEELTRQVFEKYKMLHQLFIEVALVDETALAPFIPDKKFYDALLENIKTRIKPESVEIKRTITIVSYENNGAELIRESFKALIDKVKEKQVDIKYLGSGK